jgi:hypothetical protein
VVAKQGETGDERGLACRRGAAVRQLSTMTTDRKSEADECDLVKLRGRALKNYEACIRDYGPQHQLHQ